ncbi:MAG TPA: PhzF family phenazine biosynthesis protein [Firmicutes bacterium]|nr:PhzF family phenazine biosynthesis protein [Bacillota bacterium]
MREVRVRQVDAFTNERFRGNPAGVVLHADDLTPSNMQLIAREMNLSETAFVTHPAPTSGADFGVRFFTPQTEVPFCGHATVATFFSLAEEGMLPATGPVVTVRQKTGAGVLPVHVHFGENKTPAMVMMEQNPPMTRPSALDPESIAPVLGVRPDDICGGPMGLCNTGNWHLFVPLRRDRFSSLQVDLERLAKLNREVGAITTHLYCFLSPGGTVQLHTRDFAPAVGVAEDPVTGSASGALAGFLSLCAYDPYAAAIWPAGASRVELARFLEKHTLQLPRAETVLVKLNMEQGKEIGRDGLVFTEVEISGSRVKTVRAGGQAVTVMDAVMYV